MYSNSQLVGLPVTWVQGPLAEPVQKITTHVFYAAEELMDKEILEPTPRVELGTLRLRIARSTN